jgi:hypothetical protein
MRISVLAFVLFGSLFRAAAFDPWLPCSTGMPDTVQVFSLAKSAAYLYAGTAKTGIFRSPDGGASWRPMPSHPRFESTDTWGLAVIDTFVFAGQRGGGVLRIGEGEAAWMEVTGAISSKMVQELHTAGRTLYAATMFGGVWQSDDYGASWSEVFGGKGIDDKIVYSLASNGTTLFCGTAGVNTAMPDTGVCFRAPLVGGNGWERINDGFIRNGAHLEAVSAMAASDDAVFAGTDDVGIFRSTDNGLHWKQAHITGDVHSICIVGKIVYYGTSWAGAHTSTDDGLTWQANYAGIRRGNTTMPYLVKDFLVEESIIYAATNLGVFRQRLPELPQAAAAAARPPTLAVRHYGGRLQVEASPHTTAVVRISVADAAGNIVFTAETDNRMQTFDVASLPAGVYFCTATAGTERAVAEFTLMK